MLYYVEQNKHFTVLKGDFSNFESDSHGSSLGSIWLNKTSLWFPYIKISLCFQLQNSRWHWYNKAEYRVVDSDTTVKNCCGGLVSCTATAQYDVMSVRQMHTHWDRTEIAFLEQTSLGSASFEFYLFIFGIKSLTLLRMKKHSTKYWASMDRRADTKIKMPTNL